MRRVLKKIDESVLVKDFAKALHILNNTIFYIENLNENYDGQLAFLYYYKASVLALSKDTESALASITKACELDSENVKYLCLKSNIYKILGDSENAFKTYVRVLEKLQGAIEDKEAFENAIKYAKELYTDYQNGEFTQDGLFDYFVSLYKEKEYKMSEEIFDYQSFAQSLSNQAENLIPNDITEENRNYIREKIKANAIYAGKACTDNIEINYSDEQYIFIMQVVAEWTFHKTVDLIRGGISQEYRDFILSNITNTIIEIIKESIKQETEQQELLNLVEEHVNKMYKNCLKDLYSNKEITITTHNNAIDQSNIHDMEEK